MKCNFLIIATDEIAVLLLLDFFFKFYIACNVMLKLKIYLCIWRNTGYYILVTFLEFTGFMADVAYKDGLGF
jgi:hypothetical protein